LNADGKPEKGDDGHSIHLPETARYACEHCGDLWSDGMRYKAIMHGVWRALKPFRGHASFQLNSLNSPWLKLEEIASEFLQAFSAPDKLEVFTNTFLAETYEEKGDAINEEGLISRVEAYEGVPMGVVLLTAAVDVQDDRLEVEIVGWGRDFESWQIDYVVINGNPDQPEIWAELDTFLTDHYQTEDGRVLTIRATGIDTGYKADKVAAFCRPRRGRKVWPIKGDAKGLKVPIWPATQSRGKYGKIFVINVDAAKKAVKDSLAIKEPGPGYCHFPDTRTRAYFEQFSAEELVTRFKYGHPYQVWNKKAGRRNEALDLRGYNHAVLWGLIKQGLNLDRECNRAERASRVKQVPRPEAKPMQPTASQAVMPGAWPGMVRASNPWLNA
jgi:phage terminase large subunit GpA-like protein